MLRYISILCFLTISATLLSQPINWDSVRADYIKKYQPQQMPAWLFPIIFEEGGGERDTIYLGYDPNATNNLLGTDTIFGEKLIHVDTTRFNVNICLGWYCGSGIICDTASKSNISHFSYYAQCGGGSFDFQFHKGTLPLTVYWDRNAFYSDSLPFPDQSPAPRAEGLIWMSGIAVPDSNDQLGCSGFGDNPVLVTDTVAITSGGLATCVRSDSITFIELYWLQFEVRQWSGKWLFTPNPDNKDIKASFFPNPFNDFTFIKINNYRQLPGNYRLRIYDVFGQSVREMIISDEITKLEWNGLSPGIYFYSLSTEYKIIATGKIIAQ